MDGLPTGIVARGPNGSLGIGIVGLGSSNPLGDSHDGEEEPDVADLYASV